MKKVLAFYGRVSYNKQCQGNKTADGVWRSLVARSAGGREVAGSNPVTPIFYCKIKGLRDFGTLKTMITFDYLLLLIVTI